MNGCTLHTMDNCSKPSSRLLLSFLCVFMVLVSQLMIVGCGGNDDSNGIRDNPEGTNGVPVITDVLAAPSIIFEGGSTTLTVAANDPNEDMLNYSWRKESGPGTVTFSAGNADTTEATFDIAGIYVLEITVGDGSLATSDIVTIRVNREGGELNSAPEISGVTAPTSIVYAGDTIALRATANDPDIGDTLTYDWKVLSGPALVFSHATAASTDVTPTTAGSYELEVTVSDGKLSATRSITLLVEDFPVDPTVEITSLFDGEQVSSLQSVVVTVKVIGGGEIDRVRLLVNGQRQTSDDEALYRWDLGILPVGIYTLEAKAFAVDGTDIVSEIRIEVADLPPNRVVVNSLFTDHMILQRNQSVRVYGTADEGERVSVSFNGQTHSATTRTGAWEVMLNPMAHGGPYDMIIRSSAGSMRVEDILIGDVWVLGGQSNMARSFSAYAWLMERKSTLPESDQIRLFCMESKAFSQEPTKEVVTDPVFNESWQHCTWDYLPTFSPLGYFFAIERYKMNNVPIGLIYATRGATKIESWVDKSVLESDPDYAYILDPAQNKDYDLDANGLPTYKRPSALYNAIVYPVMQFTIKGVLWNQGESNSRWPEVYKKLFPALIRSWRENWGQGDFPFVFGQLSSNEDRRFGWVENPREECWAWQREAQAAALNEPNTIMAAAYDIGEWDDIHPQDKETLGKRYVLAQAKLEGENVIASGPTYKGYEIDGNRIIISFDNLHGGLESRRVAMNKNPGLEPGTDPEAFIAPAGQLIGFTISGADDSGRFADAQAEIVGNTVVVSSPDVSNPVAVRYAWSTFALANLYNKAGLPAFPFRTDSFERPPVP